MTLEEQAARNEQLSQLLAIVTEQRDTVTKSLHDMAANAQLQTLQLNKRIAQQQDRIAELKKAAEKPSRARKAQPTPAAHNK